VELERRIVMGARQVMQYRFRAIPAPGTSHAGSAMRFLIALLLISSPSVAQVKTDSARVTTRDIGSATQSEDNYSLEIASIRAQNELLSKYHQEMREDVRQIIYTMLGIVALILGAFWFFNWRGLVRNVDDRLELHSDRIKSFVEKEIGTIEDVRSQLHKQIESLSRHSIEIMSLQGDVEHNFDEAVSYYAQALDLLRDGQDMVYARVLTRVRSRVRNEGRDLSDYNRRVLLGRFREDMGRFPMIRDESAKEIIRTLETLMEQNKNLNSDT
jgi:hypothetical protein